MKCEHAQESINQYYDGQLDKKGWLLLKDHLAGCDECLELFQKMAALNRQVKSLTFPFKPTAVLERKEAGPAFKILVAGGSAIGILVALFIGLSFFSLQKQDFMYKKSSTPSGIESKTQSYVGNDLLSDSSDAEASFKVEPIPGEARNAKDKTEKKLQLVQNISLTLKVKNIVLISNQITSIVEANGGYIANSSLATPDQQKQGTESTIVTKIPVDNLTEAKAEIRKLGVIVAEKVDTEDVSLALVDLEARLRNYKKQEARYLALIDKASRISDLENLESRLAEIRQTIEETQGELEYQKSRVAMATLTVNLVKKNKPQAGESWLSKVFSDAWQSFTDVSAGLVSIFFTLLPFVMVGLIGYGAYRLIRKR